MVFIIQDSKLLHVSDSYAVVVRCCKLICTMFGLVLSSYIFKKITSLCECDILLTSLF